MTSIAVLGSSLPGEGDPEYALARELGRQIALRGGTVLCGGYGGVMEGACRGAAEAGGESVGVLLSSGGQPNPWVTRHVVAEDLASRLRTLRDDARGWVLLPRGLGTMLELVFLAESIVKGETPPRPLVLLGGAWSTTAEKAISEASTVEGAARLRSAIRRAATASEAAAAVLPG